MINVFDVNHANKEGDTPLHVALKKSDNDMAKTILKQNPDGDVKKRSQQNDTVNNSPPLPKI